MKLNRLLTALMVATPLLGAMAATEDNAPRFPDPASAWVIDGTLPDPAAVARVALGLTTEQVRALLGSPHFDEGFTANEWNYLFQLRDGAVMTPCQVQLRFDKDRRAERLDWNRPACADLLKVAK